MPFNIRKPFVRRTTDHPVIEQGAPDNLNQVDADGKAIPHTANSGHDDGAAISSSVDQLKKFKKTHQWDYNLDYDTIVRSFTLLRQRAIARQPRSELLVGADVTQKRAIADKATATSSRNSFASAMNGKRLKFSRERSPY